MGKYETQEGRLTIPCRALTALAPHRFLHVGNQCRPVHADSISLSRLHHRYCLGQLRLVRLCVHRPAGLCLCPPLSGSQHQHTARVHGTAFRTVHTQHPGVVHHCHRHHLVAGADALCRRCTHSSGVRHTHVVVSPGAGSYLGILHHVGRSESRGLYQCLPDDTAHCRIPHSGHRRTGQGGWHSGTGRQGACRLLGDVQAQHGRSLPLVAHPVGLSRHGCLVLVHRPVDGAARTGSQGSARRSAGDQLYWLAEDSGCRSLHTTRHHLLRPVRRHTEES